MTWLVWLIVIVVVIAIVFAVLLLIQGRRRKGGVIVDPARSRAAVRAAEAGDGLGIGRSARRGCGDDRRRERPGIQQHRARPIGVVRRVGNVLGSRVLTDTGTDLGSVVDVVMEVDGGTAQCDVVGYEIEASEALGTKGTKLLIPLPDTLAASGEHLMVPASAKDFVGHDLAGFGASVQAFRTQLEGTS